MHYPDNMTVIVPYFYTVTDPNTCAFSTQLVFMPAFAILRALRQPDGSIRFSECIEIDPEGSGSIQLLANFADQLAPDTTLAGWRLHDDLAHLIRLPRDSEHEAEAKEPLMKVGLALGERPIDVCWFDEEGGVRTVKTIAAEHELDGALGVRWSVNSEQMTSQLSARASAIWIAVADRLIPAGPARRKAFASFDHFQSKGGGKTE